MGPRLALALGCCLFLLSPRSLALPTGAPPATCDTLMPQHGKVGQSSSPPYQLLPSKGQGRIRLLVGSPEGNGFDGFIVVARDVDTGEFVGEFNNLPDTAHHIDCANGKKVCIWENVSCLEWARDSRSCSTLRIKYILIFYDNICSGLAFGIFPPLYYCK